MSHGKEKPQQTIGIESNKRHNCLKMTAFTIGLVLLSSCAATLNISEIKNLERLEFEPLVLHPGREVNGLRIDLIRQTTSETSFDSITGIEDVPYHKIGFDLGNGIFYDLSANLGMRVDYLLGFSDKEDFLVDKFTKPLLEKGKTSYILRNDTMSVAAPLRRSGRYLYHVENDGSTSSYMYKRRVKYSITESDTSLEISGKRRQLRSINKVGEGHFSLKTIWRTENYRLSGNEVILSNDFLVTLTDDRKAIQIRNSGIRKSRVKYTIERSSDKIFIYNRRYSGKKIEIDGDTITLYDGRRPDLRYMLISQ